MRLRQQFLIFLGTVFLRSMSLAAVKAVECDWFSDKVPLEIHSRKELVRNIKEQKCDLSKVNWRKQWVYFYRKECQPYSDKFVFVSFKKGVLHLAQQHMDDTSKLNPDIRCNNLAACGKSGLAVILPKGEKIKETLLDREIVPCG